MRVSRTGGIPPSQQANNCSFAPLWFLLFRVTIARFAAFIAVPELYMIKTRM